MMIFWAAAPEENKILQGSGASQTSFRDSQAGLQASQAGLQTSQAGLQASQEGLRASQADFRASQAGLREKFLDIYQLGPSNPRPHYFRAP